MKQTVIASHNEELMRPVTLEEVSAAMKQLPAGKALGVDSIPAEFYQEMKEDVEPDIFNYVTKSIS